MKHFYLFLLILAVFSLEAQEPADNSKPRSITEKILNAGQFKVSGQVYPVTLPEATVIKKKKDTPLDETVWTLTDTVYLDHYLPAGEHLGVRLNVPRTMLEVISPYYNPEDYPAENEKGGDITLGDELKLSTEAQNAIRKAPKWIRTELECTLAQVNEEKQIELANVINNAEWPMIDEIAFSIAYSTPAFLNSWTCFPNLFRENAQLIYDHDEILDYVDIIEYGSEGDDDYYSTVSYWRVDTNDNKYQVEVPKEIYYFYLVHPKLSDEISTYVNPELVEYGSDNVHTDNVAEPPDGVFWRDYLFTHTEPDPASEEEEDYPILMEMVKDCEVVWDDRDSVDMAVKKITNWVNAVMNFTSEAERPHQPVRIYDLHIGRCGEHEDITNAASRACLIPCRGISSYSTDHVWNEFWDEQWWQWEPVNNSHKNNMVYESGWGKKFGTVIARRSDGVMIPVTDTYSDHPCTITIQAIDKNDKPIDGAYILLGMLVDESIYIDNFGTTNNNGMCTFVVGSGMTYYARIESGIGNNPTQSGTVFALTDSDEIEAGGEFSYKVTINGTMPEADITEIATPENDMDNFLLKVDLLEARRVTNFELIFNDLSGCRTYYDEGEGAADFFICDANNYAYYIGGEIFEAFDVMEGINSENITFEATDDNNWYALFHGENYLMNYIHIRAAYALYTSQYVGVEDENESLTVLEQNYPNPFSDYTNIKFNVANPGPVSVNIYNLNGDLVKNLASQNYTSGKHLLVWDGTDNTGSLLPTGTYYCQMDINGKRYIQQILFLGE